MLASLKKKIKYIHLRERADKDITKTLSRLGTPSDWVLTKMKPYEYVLIMYDLRRAMSYFG